MGFRANITEGFSTVELLVTLLIAAIFLLSGYALANVVLVESGDARAKIRAQILADEYVDLYRQTVGTCSPSTPIDAQSVSREGLSDVVVTVTISCPNTQITTISKVSVQVTYGMPTKSIVIDTYSASS